MKNVIKKIIKKIIRPESNSKKFDFKFDFKLLDACPLCSFEVLIPNGFITWDNTKFLYNVCTKCGLKFMNPMPTEKSCKEFYKMMFWQQKLRGRGWHVKKKAVREKEEGVKILRKKEETVRAPRIIPTLEKYIRTNKDSDVLEVGCALGVVLNKMHKQYGCNVYAIEPSIEARDYIQKQGTIKLIGSYAEELEDVANGDKKFDAIIFSHVLENTIDPFRVLKHAKQCLKKGGVIYIETPNLFTYEAMNPYHPYIFSNRTLSAMLEKIGMEFKQVSEKTDPMLTGVCLKATDYEE